MVAIAVLLGLGLAQAGERKPGEQPVRPEFFQVPTHRPTLSLVSYTASFAQQTAGQKTVLSMPVPNDYSGQTVISFRLRTEPASALKSWRWKRRADLLNCLVEIELNPTLEPVSVTYEARVLTPGEGVIRTQQKDFAAWSSASKCVQSSDPDISAIAAKFKAGAKDEDDRVSKIVRFVASNKVRQNGNPNRSDAKNALENGGDSLGRANLCAALLRAAGTPARTICTIPTWGERTDALSWITEYASDEGNWQMIDPTVGIQFPARNSIIVIAMPSIADENHTAQSQTNERSEAPDFSSPSTSLKVQWLDIPSGRRAHSIHITKVFPGQSNARLMTAGYRHSLNVIKAAEAGRSEWIEDRLLSQVIAKGPINLALFLDRKPTMPDK